MVKKILICGMCLMLMLGVSVSGEGEIPQGAPPSNMEMPQGAPPEGMGFPEGVEPPQGMPQSREGFPGGGQGQRPQGNTDNIQAENRPQANGAVENTNQPQGQDLNSEIPQEQNNNQMTPPDMNFDVSNMPGGFGRNNMQAEAEPMTFMDFVKEYQTPIISVILLLAAFVFVKLYKRRNY